MKNIRALLICLLSCSVVLTNAQSWQYFQNPDLMPKYVSALSVDASGKLWYATEARLGTFDGSIWEIRKQDSSINTLYSYAKSLAIAPDGAVWCGGQERVLEYKPGSNTWTLHNPTNSGINVNGFSITTAGDGRVFWATDNGWHEWNGTSWAHHYFYFPGTEGQDIGERSLRKIIVDPEGDKWFSTSGSIGIETGQITPAGIIHTTSLDTILYKMGEFGYPKAITLAMTSNTKGYPLAAIQDFLLINQSAPVHLFNYRFSGWQYLGKSPFAIRYASGIVQDLFGNVWVAGTVAQGEPVLLRRHPFGVWVQYVLDKQQISEILGITAGPDGTIWVGGRVQTGNGTQGALAMFPPQPLGATQAMAESCPPVIATLGDAWLHLQNLPEGASPHVEIWSMQGRLSAAFELQAGQSKYPLETLPAGVYFLRFSMENGCPSQVLKIVHP